MNHHRFTILGLLLALGLTLNVVFLTTRTLTAAPSDVRGSGNSAVASYTTSKGSYLLWSSGRITDTKTGQDVAPPYGPAPGFAQAAKLRAEPSGSPNVAVDYVQNATGTYTLFADGSVLKADDEGASAPPGMGEVITGVIDPGVLQTSASTMIVSGTGFSTQNPTNVAGQPGINNIVFDEPFDEVPVVIITPLGGYVYGLLGMGGPNTGGFTDSVSLTSVNRYGFRYSLPSDQTTGGFDTPSAPPVFQFVAFSVK